MKTAREARRSFVPFVCFCFSGFPCPLHPRYPRNSRLKLRELAYTVGFPTQIIWEPHVSFPVGTGETPEMTSHDEKSKKAKTTERKLVYEKFKHYQKPHASHSATPVSGFHY